MVDAKIFCRVEYTTDFPEMHEAAGIAGEVNVSLTCSYGHVRNAREHILVLLALHAACARKFKLTNQDSAGGKKFIVLTSM